MGNKVSNAACCFAEQPLSHYDLEKIHKQFLEEANHRIFSTMKPDVPSKRALRQKRKRSSNYRPYKKRVHPDFHSQVEIELVSSKISSLSIPSSDYVSTHMVLI